MFSKGNYPQTIKNRREPKKTQTMYKIVQKEVGELFECNLTLEKAQAMVKFWEDLDKSEGIYTPNFYEIKEDIDEGDE